MNILITGHTGFIGQHLMHHFKKMHNVYGLSRGSGYQSDITNTNFIEQLCNEKFIDLIIHTAAKPIVSNCEIDPFNAIKTNSLGTASVLEAARKSCVKKTIIFETDKVYGLQDIVPTNEDAYYNPRSPYELSKSLAATMCDFYRSYYDQDIISVRLVNIFGQGDSNLNRIIPAAMYALSHGNKIPLYNHAENMKRDFLYIEDLVRMIDILSTSKTKHNVYNISMTSPWDMKSLVEKICKTLGFENSIELINRPGNFTEIPIQEIDGTRFVNEFDFQFTDFDKALHQTYEYYKHLT
jgi:nucleoside-diphosphate-sugar epimerase